ncbi:hypothetical protein ED082_RS49410 [Escherichia coli]|jgi:hypothetical protein|uniref:YahA n=22 Tax=Enterobacteriaceae TaxID=543 RepID=H1ZXU5_ECOLX|nr:MULTISPECIES: hypothetical protein [Enterobacteriaceae]EAA3211895.1 hypothetical protein [Salmonella enterica subsp. enterica]EAA5276999.1 hypothetical protein [Salmonella enterica subsp. enterica serovar Chester]EBG0054633.1 hypothetical protein [Salmonella enterica subsp. enterica serovar Schwarzengrund]EBQ5870532.1 hypothetical protein [Salmonella enterica subsp. enterica serovar Montevideo]EBR8177192.1 hypothetical protein [Salmonella enterica subsp. enterica serovar Indiana]EBR8787798
MENHAKFVATEILNQLGGNRFIAMTGAKNFACFDENGESGLCFRLPSNFAMKGINLVKIKLTFSDTYLVTFSRVRGATVKEISKFDNIYCDQLECLFNEQTGLATRL